MNRWFRTEESEVGAHGDKLKGQGLVPSEKLSGPHL
jgi:hypothetical protein